MPDFPITPDTVLELQRALSLLRRAEMISPAEYLSIAYRIENQEAAHWLLGPPDEDECPPIFAESFQPQTGEWRLTEPELNDPRHYRSIGIIAQTSDGEDVIAEVMCGGLMSQGPANARRIVAAVNFLRGIPTEDLELLALDPTRQADAKHAVSNAIRVAKRKLSD